MSSSSSILISSFLLLSALLFHLTHADFVNVTNNCPYTVWAAAVPGGGQQLDPGQMWALNVKLDPTTLRVRLWGRTNCTFDDESGQGSCETGDCNGLLECESEGAPPYTVAEFGMEESPGVQYYEISLLHGYNVPIEFSPTDYDACVNGDIIECADDDLIGVCPDELQTPGGCNDPCTVFKTDEYCCNGNQEPICGPTDFSRFFKDRCLYARSYPADDRARLFCDEGGAYKLEFCP